MSYLGHMTYRSDIYPERVFFYFLEQWDRLWWMQYPKDRLFERPVRPEPPPLRYGDRIRCGPLP